MRLTVEGVWVLERWKQNDGRRTLHNIDVIDHDQPSAHHKPDHFPLVLSPSTTPWLPTLEHSVDRWRESYNDYKPCRLLLRVALSPGDLAVTLSLPSRRRLPFMPVPPTKAAHLQLCDLALASHVAIRDHINHQLTSTDERPHHPF